MDIIPIQSLPVVSSAAPASARVDLATTRAIEFHPQEQDSTYTPSHGSGEEAERDSQSGRGGYGLSADAQPDALSGEPGESTISLFA